VTKIQVVFSTLYHHSAPFRPDSYNQGEKIFLQNMRKIKSEGSSDIIYSVFSLKFFFLCIQR